MKNELCFAFRTIKIYSYSVGMRRGITLKELNEELKNNIKLIIKQWKRLKTLNKLINIKTVALKCTCIDTSETDEK